MRIAIVHNAVSAEARLDELDVLVQVDTVKSALSCHGHSCVVIPIDLNLADGLRCVRAAAPDVLFNLVESVGGSDQLAPLAVAALESLGIPLTGSSSQALWLTNHKILAKRQLLSAGLPTPEWVELAAETVDRGQTTALWKPGSRFILKSVTEHASLGISEAAVVDPVDAEDLQQRLRVHSSAIGCECFAERFLPGREFNISVLGDGAACRVLPLAEIDYSAFPPDKPRIVDFKAKWEIDSFEYRHTPRRFIDRQAEAELWEHISRLASRCWHVFRLSGYARVDMRCDVEGQPHILEINTNPCLSPDAGFAAAVSAGGLSLAAAIDSIVAAAVQTPLRHAPRATVDLGGAVGRRAAGATRLDPVQWRYDVQAADVAGIRELVERTGFFYPEEVAIAAELAQERLEKGEASGYYFVFAELEQQLAGYACYGPIAGTKNSHDLFWIAVDPRFQQRGLGGKILTEAERCIRAAGGGRVYIETSSRELYDSTRGFYRRCGYLREAVLEDFYGPGDGKVIYVKVLA